MAAWTRQVVVEMKEVDKGYILEEEPIKCTKELDVVAEEEKSRLMCRSGALTTG